VTTPTRGLLFHFTHISNLPSIVAHGLSCDATAQDGRMQVEVGNHDIKLRRRSRQVPIEPGGVVSDYVPFYFAARSPMLYVIWRGQVATYQGGQEDLVHIVTSVEAIMRSGATFVFTDRNATLSLAKFDSDVAHLDTLVDWELMEATKWNDEWPDHPDRKERRMAEFLVHGHVPWEHVLGIGVIDDAQQQQAQQILANMNEGTPVRVRRNWYY
jgi:hypothetical protein